MKKYVSAIVRGKKAAKKLLEEKAYTPVGQLDCIGYVTKEPVSFEKRTQGAEKEITPGDKWAEEVFDCAWFHVTGEVPEKYNPADIVFLINCGGEGLIYDRFGEPKQAITCYASDYDYALGLPLKE